LEKQRQRQIYQLLRTLKLFLISDRFKREERFLPSVCWNFAGDSYGKFDHKTESVQVVPGKIKAEADTWIAAGAHKLGGRSNPHEAFGWVLCRVVIYYFSCLIQWCVALLRIRKKRARYEHG
jgi:hypothetical protein